MTEYLFDNFPRINVPGTEFCAGDTGKCQGHDGPCDNEGTWRRQNTRYVEDKYNWVCMCDECFAVREEYWEELWLEHWSSR